MFGKTAVVTGCGLNKSGSGMGAEYALELARRGANVVLTDIRKDILQPTIDRFESEGLPYRYIALDLVDKGSADELMLFAYSVYGSVDVLVNNAAILPNTGDETKRKVDMYKRRKDGYEESPLSILRISDDEWSRFWEVNVNALFRCIRSACAYMTKQHYGRIVNIASISAFSDLGSFSPAYAASKASVHSITMNIAEECARHGILVNTFAPSGVQGGDWLKIPAHERAKVEKTIPIGRLATYGDYANIVAMLSGEHYFVGQLISPNGGVRI